MHHFVCNDETNVYIRNPIYKKNQGCSRVGNTRCACISLQTCINTTFGSLQFSATFVTFFWYFANDFLLYKTFPFILFIYFIRAFYFSPFFPSWIHICLFFTIKTHLLNSSAFFRRLLHVVFAAFWKASWFTILGVVLHRTGPDPLFSNRGQ